METTTSAEAKTIVQHAATLAGLTPDIGELEVKFFVECLSGAIGLKVVNYGMDYGVRVTSFRSQNNLFDFAECERAEIVRHARNSAGLRENICEKMLEGLESHLLPRLAQSGSVKIENIGTFMQVKGVCKLFIDERLLVPKKK